MRVMAIVAACAISFGAAFPVPGTAGTPILDRHTNQTIGPYADNQCGAVDGTSVTRLVEQYRQDASGASIDNVNLTTVFTATASGKSLTIQQSGVGKATAIVYSPDGSYSLIVSNAGLSPKFTLPDGQVIIDGGTGAFQITFDSTGNFDSLQQLYGHGPSPAACDLIISALTT